MNYSGIDIDGRSRVYMGLLIQVFIHDSGSNARITVIKEKRNLRVYTFFYYYKSVRNWGYRSPNFKKVEGYIIPTLRNWSIANSRNWILGVHEIHNFRINPSPKVPKVI